MLTLRSMLYAQSERYRHLSAALARENRDVDAEHKRILDACLAREPERACSAIDDHLQQTAKILLTSPRFCEWQFNRQQAEAEFVNERVGGQRS